MTFSLTESAIIAARAALGKRGTPEAALRVGIKGGGCSGFMYHLEFVDEPARSKDVVLEYEGLKVFVDSRSLSYLSDAKLDWEEKMFEKGFRFRNPNVSSTCGCDMSFELK